MSTVDQSTKYIDLYVSYKCTIYVNFCNPNNKSMNSRYIQSIFLQLLRHKLLMQSKKQQKKKTIWLRRYCKPLCFLIKSQYSNIPELTEESLHSMLRVNVNKVWCSLNYSKEHQVNGCHMMFYSTLSTGRDLKWWPLPKLCWRAWTPSGKGPHLMWLLHLSQRWSNSLHT